MLRVNSISNVNNTLKSNISFKAGVQTNYRVQEETGSNLVDQSILTGFVGVIKNSPLFNFNQSQINSRAESIKNGMDETKKIDMVA